jgi:hypothetical protein
MMAEALSLAIHPDIDRILREQVPSAIRDMGLSPVQYRGIGPVDLEHMICWGPGPCPVPDRMDLRSPEQWKVEVSDPSERELRWANEWGITVSAYRSLNRSEQVHSTARGTGSCRVPVFAPDRIEAYHSPDCDYRARGFRFISPDAAREMPELYYLLHGGSIRVAECGSCGGWYGEFWHEMELIEGMQ